MLYSEISSFNNIELSRIQCIYICFNFHWSWVIYIIDEIFNFQWRFNVSPNVCIMSGDGRDRLMYGSNKTEASIVSVKQSSV